MYKLGRLEEIDLRTVWEHVSQDFTKWLVDDENIAFLADTVGLDMTVSSTENIKDYILASEKSTGRRIIITNQLEDTDNEHLGKIITYAAGKSNERPSLLGADIIIWLVRHAREEHRAAIEWLNNNTSEKTGFFLCEIKLYKIDCSRPAVKFEVIEKPNNWIKEAHYESISDNDCPDFGPAFEENDSPEFDPYDTKAESGIPF